MRTILMILGLAGLVMTPGCQKEKKKADTSQMAEPETQGAGAPAKAAGGGAAAAGQGAPGGETGGAAVTGGATSGGPATGRSPGEAPTMGNKMAHCPSAVPGAETTVAESKGAVVVTVTAKGKARVAEIQKRAEHLDRVEAAPDSEIKHTGMGTGGGALGKCPVVMAEVTLKVEKQRDGVKVTLVPKDPSKVGELAMTAKDRVAGLKDLGAGRAEPDDEEPGEDAEPEEE
jgi:hypothetical protein